MNCLGLLRTKSRLNREVPRDRVLNRTSQRDSGSHSGPFLVQVTWPFKDCLVHFFKMALFTQHNLLATDLGRMELESAKGHWIATNDYSPFRNNRLRESPEKSCAYEITSPTWRYEKTWTKTKLSKCVSAPLTKTWLSSKKSISFHDFFNLTKQWFSFLC